MPLVGHPSSSIFRSKFRTPSAFSNSSRGTRFVFKCILQMLSKLRQKRLKMPCAIIEPIGENIEATKTVMYVNCLAKT
jgi:hypothetical protein